MTTKQLLPPDVIAADLKYPKSGCLYHEAGDYGAMKFYRVDGRQGSYWAIATLAISKSRNGRADRTYAVTLTGGVVTVGNGPHVKETVTVYLDKKRAAGPLKKYVELYVKGKADAGMIRDRIGSRRAQGQLERAAGNTYWRWDR